MFVFLFVFRKTRKHKKNTSPFGLHPIVFLANATNNNFPLCAKHSFLVFQNLRPAVIAVDAARGGGGSLNLTNGWVITSEEALFPCVQEWAKRKQ